MYLLADVTANNDKNSDMREKLIVRIGNSEYCGTTASDEYVKNRFSDGFRNSLMCRGSHLMTISSSWSDLSKPKASSKWNGCYGDNGKLKSTSLIIDTIKRSMETKVQISNPCREAKMEKKISELRKNNEKHGQYTLEQPSTYLTEMNKLQQKYRVKQNKLTPKCGKLKPTTRVYNTVPGTKNSFTRSNMMSNDQPSVFSAFDRLHQSMEKNYERSPDRTNCDIANKTSTVKRQCSSKYEKYSSQSWFLSQIAAQEDDISDDSLKADEEVRSYMSTAIMEEYENELSGSWSRRRYFKHVDPIKGITKEGRIRM